MKFKSLLIAAALAVSTPGLASATILTFETLGSASITFNPNSNIQFTYTTNLAGGSFNFNSNGFYQMGVNAPAGRTTMTQSAAGVPAAFGDVRFDSTQMNYQGHWGSQQHNLSEPNTNIIHLFDTIVALSQGQTVQSGTLIDADFSAVNPNGPLAGNEGTSALYVLPNGQPDPRIHVPSQGCPSGIGCVGDIFQTADALGRFFTVTFDRLQSIQSGSDLLTYAYFNIAGTGSQIVNGTSTVNFRFDPGAQIRYLVNTSHSSVPEPATVALLSGSLIAGAYRKRKLGRSSE